VRVAVLLAVSVSLMSAGSAAGDEEFEHIARGGIEQVYNLEFAAADSSFRQLVNLRPGDPAGYFFLAMVDWWRIMVDKDNTEYDERFLEELDHVIDLCNDRLDENEEDVTALFFKGGSLGFTGRLHFYRDDWFGAAGAGRKALPLVQTASAADSTNYDIYLGTGIYNYYAAVIPELYPVARPLLLFIPPGDKAEGIRQLTIAAEKGKYASVEATYFLMQIYYLYEKDYPRALDLAEKLHDRFPNNMLFHRYLGRCYVSSLNYPAARSVFEDVIGRAQKGQTGYDMKLQREAEYYLGLCGFHAGSYAEAIEHYLTSDQISRTLDTDGPSAFMVLANLNLGKIYDVQSRRELAIIQYEKVLEMTDYMNSHQQAEQYIEKPYSR